MDQKSVKRRIGRTVRLGRGGRGGRGGGSGRVIRGTGGRFDPNARDADNDGIVQEGTRFARRATSAKPRDVSVDRPKKPVKVPMPTPGTTQSVEKWTRDLGDTREERLDNIVRALRSPTPDEDRNTLKYRLGMAIRMWDKAPRLSANDATPEELAKWENDYQDYIDYFLKNNDVRRSIGDFLLDGMVADLDATMDRVRQGWMRKRSSRDFEKEDRKYRELRSQYGRARSSRGRREPRVVQGRVPAKSDRSDSNKPEIGGGRRAAQGTTPMRSSDGGSKADQVRSAIDRQAKKTSFDAEREYGDYEQKFPKHEVDGMMGRDSADLVKMREMMKDLISEAEKENVRYGPISRMSDADLQDFWASYNAMKSPETRAQFLAMMLGDFELGMRKMARDRDKNGPRPHEDAKKVSKIVANIKNRNLL